MLIEDVAQWHSIYLSCPRTWVQSQHHTHTHTLCKSHFLFPLWLRAVYNLKPILMELKITLRKAFFSPPHFLEIQRFRAFSVTIFFSWGYSIHALCLSISGICVFLEKHDLWHISPCLLSLPQISKKNYDVYWCPSVVWLETVTPAPPLACQVHSEK
jgi:hypothetical protein